MPLALLLRPVDPSPATPSASRPTNCSTSEATMNHPYMFPEDAPWTDEYLDKLETINKGRGFPDAFDDEEEFLDALFWVV
jgi:hypothetical protein